MSSDIARRSDFPLDSGQQITMAKALAEAGVLPAHLRKQPANILAIGMAARALDVPTWTALQQIVPIDGKTTIQADLMRALILRAGHRFRVEHADPGKATVVIVRADDPDFEHRVTVTLAELPADLTKKQVWKSYPADMLIARATAKVARRACSDVLNGMSYTPEELGADTDDDGQATAVPAQAEEVAASGEPFVSASVDDLMALEAVIAALDDSQLAAMRQLWKAASLPTQFDRLTPEQSVTAFDLIAQVQKSDEPPADPEVLEATVIEDPPEGALL